MHVPMYNRLVYLVLASSALLVDWRSLFPAGKFAVAATVAEQWEDEYSKIGKVMHTYAQNTKFKSLRGVMIVPGTREVVWLTERCNFASTGFDDCDFYLQNVQTLMSIEQNPICRRAGGLSFSLDPWDSSDIWGSLYRKVYYPSACASILRSSIAGATMFDADWDLKQLVNNTLGVGNDIEGYQSVDQLVDLSNFLFDERAASTSSGSSSTATTALTMTRLWVAVTGIEEAVTPDHSVLYFGNVSIEVRAASVVKNISTASGFSDSKLPPPFAYRKFVELINHNMHHVLRHLKSFRQLAQLAVAQEAVKFVSAREGVFPDGYLQALDYTLYTPQQVPAVVSSIDQTSTIEIISQLVKRNSTAGAGAGAGSGDAAEIDTLVAENLREKSQLEETTAFPLQEIGDDTIYQYSCSVINGSIAKLRDLQQVLKAQLLTLNCEQIVEKSPEESEDQYFEANAPKNEPQGIFCEKAGFADPCLPGAVAVWDVGAGAYFMVPSAYLFIPGIPRMYNTTGDVVLVKWGCTWPEFDDEEENEGDEQEGAARATSGEGGGGRKGESAEFDNDDSDGDYDSGRNSPYSESFAQQESDSFTHTHTHYSAIPADASRNTRRLQMVYNVTLPGYVDRNSIDGSTVSLAGKVVVIQMPRSWETLPAACALPSLLRELQNEWVFDSDGLGDSRDSADVDIDLDGAGGIHPNYVPSAHRKSRFSSTSVGAEKDSGSIGHSGSGAGAVAGVVLIHSVDFILPVVEIDSGYLGDVTLNAPVRVISHNYGIDLVEQIQTSSVPISASLACGISRTADVKEEETDSEDEDAEAPVFSVEFGKSLYRTLDGVSINSKVIGCQADYLQIPEGYELAPPLEDILTHVVAEHSWGTDKVVLSDMSAYCTTLCTSHRPGKLMRDISIEWDPVSANGTHQQQQEQEHGNNLLGDRENVVAIRPSVCSSRILIRTKAVMVPYGGFFYHTLDLAEVSGDSGCQLIPLVLPEFCDVAPAISDVLNNIVAPHDWATDALILQDRRAYFTSRAGASLAGKVCCDRDELLHVADRPRNASSSSAEYSPEDATAEGAGGADGSSGSGRYSSFRGNASAPHWSDSEQVLSVLRCNTRILVRQPILTLVAEDTTAPSLLHFQDLKKVTQAVSINITRISYGDTTTDSNGKAKSYSFGTEFRGKLLPGAVKSHIYSLSVRLKYTQFTHGGVDLMNIKVTRMNEVPPEVLQQLQDRSSSASSIGGGSGSGGWDGSQTNRAGRIVPETEEMSFDDAPAKRPSSSHNNSSSSPQPAKQAAHKTGKTVPSKSTSSQVNDATADKDPEESQQQQEQQQNELNVPSGRENIVAMASSGALSEEFAAEFQERRNAWGKRLGAALDHLDNHILGNADADSEGANQAVDFIYRPSSFSALKMQAADAAAEEAAEVVERTVLDSDIVGATGVKTPAERQELLRASLQEVIVKVKLARRRYFQDTAAAAETYSENAEAATSETAQQGSAARAITALLVETALSHTQFLVQYQEDGVVHAHLVDSMRPLGISGMAILLTSTSVTAASSDSYRVQESQHDWKLQLRWSEVQVGEVSVAALLLHMQQSANVRGAYHAAHNNCHMAQEDGRRYLGLSVELAQSLLL